MAALTGVGGTGSVGTVTTQVSGGGVFVPLAGVAAAGTAGIALPTGGTTVQTIHVTSTSASDALAMACIGENVAFRGGAIYTGDLFAAGTYTRLDAAWNSTDGSAVYATQFALRGMRSLTDPGRTLLDRGCILTTGVATDAAAFPTGHTSTDLGELGPPGDNTQLTFDFSNVYPIVVIPFIFGSEEYNEFVMTPFNDQCVVYLDGDLISLLPDRVTQITIHNINLLNANRRYFFSNFTALGLTYDGLVITNLVIFLLPGTTHTLSINVFDVEDGIFDSAGLLGQITSYPGRPTAGMGEGSLYAFLHDLLPRATHQELVDLVDEYIAVMGTDTRLFVQNGTGAEDDGEVFQAYVKTRAFQPGGDLAHQGEVAHTAQPLLIARPADDTAMYLDIIRDLEVETQRTAVDLTPVASERRVIRKYESAAMGDATEVQFQLGDAAPIASAWDLHLFSVRLTPGGMR